MHTSIVRKLHELLKSLVFAIRYLLRYSFLADMLSNYVPEIYANIRELREKRTYILIFFPIQPCILHIYVR